MTGERRLHSITECGIPGITHVPYGAHLCHFYPTREELIAALVPFFAAGLRNNERCLWVTAPPLEAMAARAAFEKAWPAAQQAIAKGALRIIDFGAWYKDSGALRGTEVVRVWLQEEERALRDGYQGLRITGNTSFLTDGDWSAFMKYEHAVSQAFAGRRIVALCSYALQHRHASEVLEVVRAHHCALHRTDEAWQVGSPF